MGVEEVEMLISGTRFHFPPRLRNCHLRKAILQLSVLSIQAWNAPRMESIPCLGQKSTTKDSAQDLPACAWVAKWSRASAVGSDARPRLPNDFGHAIGSAIGSCIPAGAEGCEVLIFLLRH